MKKLYNIAVMTTGIALIVKILAFTVFQLIYGLHWEPQSIIENCIYAGTTISMRIGLALWLIPVITALQVLVGVVHDEKLPEMDLDKEIADKRANN